MNEKIVFLDISKCLACQTCRMECAASHSSGKDLFSALEEGVKPRNHVVGDLQGSMPVFCQHCEDAPCVLVCPTGALTEKETVEHDPSLCIGCRLCMTVCPFGAVDLVDNKAYKCDLCIARVKEGLEPACVESCPTKALKFIEIEKVSAEKQKEFFGRVFIAQKVEGEG